MNFKKKYSALFQQTDFEIRTAQTYLSESVTDGETNI